MKSRLFGLALVAALGLAACGDDNNGNDITARLRAVHLSPGAPAVDVLVGGTRQFTNVAYAQPTDYEDVPTGDRTLAFVPTGDTTTLGVISEELQLGQSYTLLALGLPASLEPVLLSDTTTAPASGKVRVRVVHGAPSVGAVDVYVTEPSVDIATVTPTLSNVAFGDASNYLTLDEGTYRIRVTAIGGTDPALDQTVTLSSGAVRTVIARDAPTGGEPIGAVVLDDRS